MPWRQPTFRPKWLPKPKDTRTSSHGRGYGSARWQRVRLAVIARDGATCQMCGTLIHKPGDAQVDHIDRKPKDEAAEATPLDGLRLLCRSCHSRHTASG